jgi:hypothetical protein
MNRLGFAILLALTAMAVSVPPASAQTTSSSAQGAYAQEQRPRIIIRPRKIRPGPNSKRYCRARLVQEYRPSGTVIVPQTFCWWQ